MAGRSWPFMVIIILLTVIVYLLMADGRPQDEPSPSDAQLFRERILTPGPPQSSGQQRSNEDVRQWDQEQMHQRQLDDLWRENQRLQDCMRAANSDSPLAGFYSVGC